MSIDYNAEEVIAPLMRGVDARAKVMPSETGARAWEIVLDAMSSKAEEPMSVQTAKGTVLYQTKLQDHIQLIQA